MYNHRGWDLCQTGETLTRFQRSMPVTYTICMYDTVNALAPRGCYVACISACGVIFTQAAVLVLQLGTTITCTGTPSTSYLKRIRQTHERRWSSSKATAAAVARSSPRVKVLVRLAHGESKPHDSKTADRRPLLVCAYWVIYSYSCYTEYRT